MDPLHTFVHIRACNSVLLYVFSPIRSSVAPAKYLHTYIHCTFRYIYTAVLPDTADLPLIAEVGSHWGLHQLTGYTSAGVTARLEDLKPY